MSNGKFQGMVEQNLKDIREDLCEIKTDIKDVRKKTDDNCRKINYAYAWFAGVSACFVFLVAYLKNKLFGE